MVLRIEDSVSQHLQSGQIAEAVELIITTLGPELRGYLRGTLGDGDEGDDVFQEVVIAVWERLQEFRFHSSLRTWCYAIAHHRVKKRFARYSRRNRVRLDTDQQARLPARSLTSLLEHQQRAESMAAAAAALAPNEREILILRAERQLSFGEIAKVLGLTNEAHARKRFQRAKERLKELVSPVEPAKEI